jgi:hypothetical protein
MAGERPVVMDTTDVARVLGVEPWMVARLYQRGLVDEPPRCGNSRVLTPSDLPALRSALEQAGYLPGKGR